MNSSLEKLGYDILSQRWDVAGRVAYRAIRKSDGQICLLETVDARYPSRQEIIALKREEQLTQRLSGVAGVRRINRVIPNGSNAVLEGECYDCNLAQLIADTPSRKLPLLQTLKIAISLTETLGEIHQKGLVHKAICPQHVLVNQSENAFFISGFSGASELDREYQPSHLPEQFASLMPYISPEQTGRMNRDLDYRSDYYSLGILLFELLTGRQPFIAKEPLEWVYSHICHIPTAPDELNTCIPKALSNIVLKLLAKCPEERYQNHQSLKYDLAHCYSLLESGKPLVEFELGKKKAVQKFLVPQSLYGRDQELAQLLDLFEQAVDGKNKFCLVHGYSGVGKSALVNEIDRYQIRERGFLVQSKFDQFQQGEAYAAIAATYRSLVHEIMKLSNVQIDAWREKLLNALSPNAILVTDLVPELATIIGDQPEVPELPPAEAKNRLNLVLADFLNVFAGQGHPVVLFLDDLHWSDLPTLDLLRRITSSREQSHLLLIAAYRSNEVSAGHPLHALLDDLKSHNNIVHIPLKPLNKGAITELVADSLSTDTEQPKPLVDLVFEKAKGNPFFTNELLKQLHKQGSIKPDYDHGRWQWEIDTVYWTDVSDNVVSFMLDNLRQLPAETQNVLQLAACIGATFDLNTLSAIYQQSLSETAKALLPAMKQQTVFALNSHYHLVDGFNESEQISLNYRFQHDRVQQAAYRLIDKTMLPKVHLSIGRLLLQAEGTIVSNAKVTDIVGHLNQGRDLITNLNEKVALAELNLRAGQRAKNTSAYKSALNYFLTALALLPDDNWSVYPDLMKTLASDIQQCFYLIGETKEAEHWIEIMLSNAESDLHKSDILATRTRQYATLGRMKDSIESAIQGLALLNIDFTNSPTQADIDLERHRIEVNLAGRKIADLVDSKITEDPAVLVASRLMMEIFAAAFLSASGNLFPYLILKSVNLSLQNGNSKESAFTYAAYGMLLCGELDEPALGYEYGKVGMAINERLDDLTLRARVIYVYAMFVHHWNNHWSTLTPLFKRGIEAGYQTGDLLYLAYSAQDCVIWDPTLDLQTAEQMHAENLEIVRECAYQDSLDSGTLFLQMQRNLLGLTHSPTSLSDSEFDVQACLEGMQNRQFMTGIANHHIYNAEVCFLYGEYDKALTYVRAQDPLIKSAMSLPQLTRFYLVANLTLCEKYRQMFPEQQRTTLMRLKRDLARMTRWANNCEDNFRHIQYLMAAEIARIEDDNNKVLSLFEQAINTASKNGFLRDEACACERAAHYLLSKDQSKAAEGYLRAALHIYSRWGAKRKVNWLLQRYPVLSEVITAQSIGNDLVKAPDLDLASVMKASRQISGEIVLERLLKRTMSIAIENAGARWGCLVVRKDNEVRVEALQLPDSGFPSAEISKISCIKTAEGESVALPLSIVNSVLNSGEAVVLNDAANVGEFTRDPYVTAKQSRSIFCIPIKRIRFEGVLYMENALSSGVFTESSVEIIKLLAAQAAVAIDNARLYEQVQDYSHSLEAKVIERTAKLEQLNSELQNLAERDGLTDVANRRRGDSYLHDVWMRQRREEQPLSVIMLDVDHFKAFNDNYGHQLGDDCLKRVAQSVDKQLGRIDDMVARYGGEEFIVILPNTDSEGALQVGESIRAAVQELAIEHQHSSAANVVTVSLGSATAIPKKEELIGIEELVGNADKALYKAKRNGRNQIQTLDKKIAPYNPVTPVS